MVMGQMREEGQSRPPGFEDSPPPPGPVHLQRSDPPQKPRNNQIKEGLPLCAHAYVFISYILPPPELLGSTSKPNGGNLGDKDASDFRSFKHGCANYSTPFKLRKSSL